MEKHGFELQRTEQLPELNTTAHLYRHIKTGAELLSLENNDENKVFGITFRTPPEDSTGVSHIMEHSVLCGSERFPLKEPFVELVKGSLNTFINAFTYPDKTCYPLASQNVQDFYNLIDVYMDAVLHPLLSPYTLDQEGWRYELESMDGPLTFKGVVFNEMKGAYSSPDNLLGRASQQAIFPDNTYGVDSGGDPTVIPNLSYEQWQNFHAQYYHPSNARLFFYGDDDPEERLRRMDAYLGAFERQPVASEIGLQTPWREPRRVTAHYDAGEAENGAAKAYVTLNWMLAQNDDPETTLGLNVLAHILIGTPASPLRKALIDSGYGEDLTSGGYEDELRQTTFSAGLKGIQPADADKVEQLILDTLQSLVDSGIDAEMIAASMNTIEFRLRENNTGSFPRGLALMLRSLSTWLHGGDPFAPLAFEAPLGAIKARLAQGEPYFEALIRRFLLENPHRAQVLLTPEAGLRQKQEAAERQRLEAVSARLTAAERTELIQRAAELKRRQETPDPPERLAELPTLELSDLEPEVKTIPLDIQQASDVPVLYHDLFTNGIVYLDLGFNLKLLPQEYLPYLPVFARALVSIGAGERDFVKLAQHIGRYTGGIYTTPFTSHEYQQNQDHAWVFIRAKATLENAPQLLDILRDLLLHANLDNRERFRQMVLEDKARREASLIPAGHVVVNSRLRAHFTQADWASEAMNGLEGLFAGRQLAEAVDRDWPAVLEKLETMRRLLINRAGMLANVTLDADNYAGFAPQLESFIAALPHNETGLHTWQPDLPTGNEGLTIPAQVNYVGKGANLYDLGYQLDGSVFVIQKLLYTTWLWEQVRMRGGAYGAFGVFDHHSGVQTFVSYRDPNLESTLDAFDGAAAFLQNIDLPPDELKKGIIGAIGDMDAYQLPDAKGYSAMLRYLTGDTDEARQQRRADILDASAADFRAFGERLAALNQAGQVVVLGAQEAIAAANQNRPGWLQVKKVL